MDLWPSDATGLGPVLSGGISFLGDGGDITAAEGAAATMLAVIALVAGLVGFFAWTLIRRSRRPDETLQFLDHLHRDREPPQPQPAPEPTRPPEPGRLPWEKPDDWWKK